jgi:hypothetical protein
MNHFHGTRSAKSNRHPWRKQGKLEESVVRVKKACRTQIMKSLESHRTEIQIAEVLFVSTLVGLLAALAIPNAVDARCSREAALSAKGFPPAQACVATVPEAQKTICQANVATTADSVCIASSVTPCTHWVPAHFANPAPTSLAF